MKRNAAKRVYLAYAYKVLYQFTQCLCALGRIKTVLDNKYKIGFLNSLFRIRIGRTATNKSSRKLYQPVLHTTSFKCFEKPVVARNLRNTQNYKSIFCFLSALQDTLNKYRSKTYRDIFAQARITTNITKMYQKLVLSTILSNRSKNKLASMAYSHFERSLMSLFKNKFIFIYAGRMKRMKYLIKLSFYHLRTNKIRTIKYLIRRWYFDYKLDFLFKAKLKLFERSMLAMFSQFEDCVIDTESVTYRMLQSMICTENCAEDDIGIRYNWKTSGPSRIIAMSKGKTLNRNALSYRFIQRVSDRRIRDLELIECHRSRRSKSL